MHDNGGPAFPVVAEQSLNGISPSPGMSIRDFFAAAAMQGWLASFSDECPHPAKNGEGAMNVAKMSYKMADAMLKARED